MSRSSAIHGIGMTSARTRDRLVDRLRQQGISSTPVLERIRGVPRHLFVDEALASRAYEDTALPIGMGQTISQPYVVACMTEAVLGSAEGGRVLEIGTGCGYQTAVLSPLVERVFTVERIPELLAKTRRRLATLNVYNVQYRRGDGWEGWPKYAPYDGIIVAAAAPELPARLLGQLVDGGRLVIPIGPPRNQKLVCVTRRGERIERSTLCDVSFVPLVAGR